MKILETDVLIVGAGISGFSTAISAALEGAHVLLIDKAEPGGNATRVNVGTFCGLFFRSDKKHPIPINHPFLEWFKNSYKNQDEQFKPLNHHNGLWVLPYNNVILTSFIQQQLHYQKVATLFNSTLIDIKTSQRIEEVIVSNGQKLIKIKPNNVVDCTGIGLVNEIAGGPMIKEDSYQAASQVIQVSRPDINSEFSLNMSLSRFLSKYKEQLPQGLGDISLSPGSLTDDHADLKLTLKFPIADNLSVDDLKVKVKRIIALLLPMLNEKVPSFAEVGINKIYPEIGIRVLKRPEGKSILTKENVIKGEKVEDPVAIGTWPIEEWNKNGQVEMTYLEGNDSYHIPLGCLQAKDINNLYFAGKGISATADAIASARVMGTCMQTGYASGKLAASTTDEQFRDTKERITGELR